MVQSRHVDNSGQADRRGGGYQTFTGERFGVCLSSALSLSHPSHSHPHPPPQGVKHLLVMTMPQTALFSLSAFLERQCNSAKKASA